MRCREPLRASRQLLPPPPFRAPPLSSNRQRMSTHPTVSELRSGVISSPADALLSEAIRSTLQVRPEVRAAHFQRLVLEIEAFMAAHPEERPWTCTIFTGTDGSRVFRGGVGHSLVIDLAGRLWRARSYEDFLTTYTLAQMACDIATLTPLYSQMQEYLATQLAFPSNPRGI